jgi:hypothetical protein
LIHFIVICYILLPLGIFVAYFGIFFRVLVYFTEKNLATLTPNQANSTYVIDYLCLHEENFEHCCGIRCSNKRQVEQKLACLGVSSNQHSLLHNNIFFVENCTYMHCKCFFSKLNLQILSPHCDQQDLYLES